VELSNQTAAAAATVDQERHSRLLEDLLARVAPCFARRETRLTCRHMVNGLLTGLDDHNCCTMAEAAGHPGPHRMQHLLSRARFDEQLMLDTAADWAAGHLAGAQAGRGGDAVLIVDLCRSWNYAEAPRGVTRTRSVGRASGAAEVAVLGIVTGFPGRPAAGPRGGSVPVVWTRGW
jgi:hypothetical protein